MDKFAHSRNKSKLHEGHVNDNDVHSNDKVCSSAHILGVWSMTVLLGQCIEYYYQLYYYLYIGSVSSAKFFMGEKL